MSKIRRKGVATLEQNILNMSLLVETSIELAIESLVNRDSKLARQVIDKDKEINALDVEIEEDCIKLLALSQPMASDLRFIATAMKIAANLERIADNAVNVAERALEINQEEPLEPYADIISMAKIAKAMVMDAIQAFFNQDRQLALDVIVRDDQVDELNGSIAEDLLKLIVKDVSSVGSYTKITYISKYIERMGDHATNIAEIVLFLIDGKIVRHKDVRKL